MVCIDSLTTTVNVDARVEDESTIQDVHNDRFVDLDLVNLHALVVERISTIQGVQEDAIPQS